MTTLRPAPWVRGLAVHSVAGLLALAAAACGARNTSLDDATTGLPDGAAEGGVVPDAENAGDGAHAADARDGRDANDAIDARDALDARVAADADGVGDAGDAGDAGQTIDPCEPFGHYPAPATGMTFTLPPPQSSGDLYYPDVQQSFPNVDWAHIDRLYIRAGDYRLIKIGNLPQRTADRPLIITNTGGQVRIAVPAGSGQGYIWVMQGGSHWILTGRYDPVAQTGDASFPGHRCGHYANSRGTYGFLSDGNFVNSGHMGLAIADAADWEIEFLEITRPGFAGVRANNRHEDGTVVPFGAVSIHDNYVHDTGSEGLYIGWTKDPPSALLAGLQVFNNRVLRTGTETAQLQNLGAGTEVHHNVFAWGALDWRAAFQQYQDNASQAQVREGDVSFHHNVVMGGAASLMNFFSGPESGDSERHVTFSDNYLADSLNLGFYLGGTSGAGSSYTFERNWFRGLTFGYDAVYPASPDRRVVFLLGTNFDSPVLIDQNTWEGDYAWVAGLTGGDGARGAVTARQNLNTAVAPVTFVDVGALAGVPTRALEMWTAVASLAPNDPPVTYEVGALVMHLGSLYECTARNSNQPPDAHPESWRLLPPPPDDVRIPAGSPYEGLGLP